MTDQRSLLRPLRSHSAKLQSFAAKLLALSLSIGSASAAARSSLLHQTPEESLAGSQV